MSEQEAIDRLKTYTQPAYSDNCACCREWQRRVQEILSLLEQAQQQEAFDHAKKTVAGWSKWKQNASRKGK